LPAIDRTFVEPLPLQRTTTSVFACWPAFAIPAALLHHIFFPASRGLFSCNKSHILHRIINNMHYFRRSTRHSTWEGGDMYYWPNFSIVSLLRLGSATQLSTITATSARIGSIHGSLWDLPLYTYCVPQQQSQQKGQS